MSENVINKNVVDRLKTELGNLKFEVIVLTDYVDELTSLLQERNAEIQNLKNGVLKQQENTHALQNTITSLRNKINQQLEVVATQEVEEA